MSRGAYNQNTLWNILFGTSLKTVKASCQGTLQSHCPHKQGPYKQKFSSNKGLTEHNALTWAECTMSQYCPLPQLPYIITRGKHQDFTHG